MIYKSIISLLLAFLLPQIVFASEHVPGGDFFRSTGKINVVFAVILVIFAGIVIYLIRLDKKITRLEKQFNNE
jgi:CcmD family protein